METQEHNINELIPVYRYKLKGAIHSAGYRTVAEFALNANVDAGIVSKIILGWHLPSAQHQRKMAHTLGISLKEMVGLLLN